MGVYKLSSAGSVKVPRVNYSSMLAGNLAFVESSFELITTNILTSSQSSVTFGNLDQYASTYKHFQLRMTARTTGGATEIIGRLNNDSGANYAQHRMLSDTSALYSNGYTGRTFAQNGLTLGSTAPTGRYSFSVVDLHDAFAAKNKTFYTLSGAYHAGSLTRMDHWSTVWLNTASVTSWIVSASGTEFSAGSRFSLYGIKG